MTKMTPSDCTGLERIYQRKAERVNQLYQQRHESIHGPQGILDEMLQLERRYADSREELSAFLGILISASEIFPPQRFEQYAPSILKIIRDEPFICYNAGLRWSTENFTHYAAQLGEGITHSPRLCYKMLCDLLPQLDRAAGDKNLLEQFVRESILMQEPWKKERIEAIEVQLLTGLAKDPELLELLVSTNYLLRLDRMEDDYWKHSQEN